MEIECPECDKVNDIDGDDLPVRACDSAEFQCTLCDHLFDVGWYATVELR